MRCYTTVAEDRGVSSPRMGDNWPLCVEDDFLIIRNNPTIMLMILNLHISFCVVYSESLYLSTLQYIQCD